MSDLEHEFELEKLYRQLLVVELGDRDDEHSYIKFLVAVHKTLSIRMGGDKRHQRPAKLLDGQITRTMREPFVQPLAQKYSAFAVGQISDLTPRVSPE